MDALDNDTTTEGTGGGVKLVRATVKMQGVVVGETVYVDPSDPTIRRLIEAKLLASVDEEGQGVPGGT